MLGGATDFLLTKNINVLSSKELLESDLPFPKLRMHRHEDTTSAVILKTASPAAHY